MDARTFEPDDPLPRICKHCKWCISRLRTWCEHPKKEGLKPGFGLVRVHTPRRTHPDNTCDQWEEKA